MSLVVLTLLTAEALREDPTVAVCPVEGKDARCGTQLVCHRPCDVAALFDGLPPSTRPMRWLCGEFLVRRGAVLSRTGGPWPPAPWQGTCAGLGTLPVAGGLGPLLRWLEESDAACFLLWAGRGEDGYWRALYAYLHLPTATTVHVVAAGPADRLAIMRTLQTGNEAEAWESMRRFAQEGG